MRTLKISFLVLILSITISGQNFWQKITVSLGDVEVTDLCLTKSGFLLAYIRYDGLYYTTNNGEQWIRTNYQGYDPQAIETINDSIFIAGQIFNIIVSNDFGNTWNTTADFGTYNKHSIFYDSDDQLLYFGSVAYTNDTCGIYTSGDYGYNWKLIYSFPMIAFFQQIGALCVTETNKIILLEISYGWPNYGSDNKFFKSSDQGQNWEIIFDHTFVRQTIEDANLTLFACAGNYGNSLLVSEDEGETWTTKNIPETDFMASDNEGRIYSGGNNELNFSIDKGDTWFAMPTSGLQQCGKNDMVINQQNRIYVATTKGVFWGEADSLVVSVEKTEPLKAFSLSQNYPNPFNPITEIKYEIPSQARNDNALVTLKVYDILGREVATLLNEEKPAGEYEVKFDGTGLPSGIYFYQLKAGAFIETKKMVLMK
jgi:photosystem II stability/assembly factor-like uncharacterized protein